MRNSTPVYVPSEKYVHEPTVRKRPRRIHLSKDNSASYQKRFIARSGTALEEEFDKNEAMKVVQPPSNAQQPRIIHARSVEQYEDYEDYAENLVQDNDDYNPNDEEVKEKSYYSDSSHLPKEHRGIESAVLPPVSGPEDHQDRLLDNVLLAYPARQLDEPHQFINVDGYNKFKAGHNRGNEEHQTQDVQERLEHHHRQEVMGRKINQSF